MKLTVSKTMALFGVIVSIGLVASIAVQNYALSQLKINGPNYKQIVYGKDLVADILPPPLFVVESYMLASEGVLHPERAAENFDKIKALRVQYNDRTAYWAASDLEPGLKRDLADDVLRNGDVFWNVMDQKLVVAGDDVAKREALDELMTAFYTHQAAVQKLVEKSTVFLANAEQTAGREGDVLTTAAILGAGLSVILFIAGLLYVRRRTIVPILGIGDYMGKLAAGDYSSQVPYASRGDEIGTMSQAVEVFRQNAIERQAHRRREEVRQAEEIENERRAAQDVSLADEKRQAVIGALTNGLELLAAGRLDTRIEQPFAEAYEKLRLQFNQSLEGLARSLGEIAQSSDTVRDASTEIAQATDELARRTEQQAATIEQTAAAIEEITVTVRTSAERAAEASRLVAETRSGASHSAAIVREAIGAMEKIAGSSTQISQIINVIDEIAFQTNLLALNAGVEAARAGDAGKGFAVVAQEVRELASRSANAAKEIKALITASGNQVTNGVALVNQTGDVLGKIEVQVGSVNTMIADIVTATSEQAEAIGEINASVNHMDQVTQQNAAMAEQTNAACRGLSDETERLQHVVGRFTVDRAMATAQTSSARMPASQRVGGYSARG